MGTFFTDPMILIILLLAAIYWMVGVWLVGRELGWRIRVRAAHSAGAVLVFLLLATLGKDSGIL